MNTENPKVYAVKHPSDAIRLQSQSGGLFTAFSDFILEKSGVIYGCALNERLEAVHIRTETENGRNRMRGSKYVQSNPGDTFQQVKADLENGKNVMFTGTSCQVAGLRRFLGKDYPSLLLADIVCHGVATPLLVEKYLAWQKEKNKKEIISINFRNKKDFGWKKCIETILFADHSQVNSDVYKRLYFSHQFTRPSCFQCPYKQIMHPGDITIGDYWGIEKAAPDFLTDDMGVSILLVNNDRGAQYFEAVKDSLEWRETRIEDSMQHPFVGPYAPPKNGQKGIEELLSQPFETVAVKYGGYGLKNKLIRGIKKILSGKKN